MMKDKLTARLTRLTFEKVKKECHLEDERSARGRSDAGETDRFSDFNMAFHC